MNLAHTHLFIHHVPIFGVIFDIILLLSAIFMKREELKRTSLWIFIILALLALPVFFTGEPAKKVVDNLNGVDGSLIQGHEEVARYAIIAIEILGFVCLLGLLVFRRSKVLPRWLVDAILIVSIIVGSLMLWTGGLGLKIHHEETRDDFIPPPRVIY